MILYTLTWTQSRSSGSGRLTRIYGPCLQPSEENTQDRKLSYRARALARPRDHAWRQFGATERKSLSDDNTNTPVVR